MDAAKPGETTRRAPLLAIAGGLAFALFWALGFVVALNGIRNGLEPADIVFHRLIWPGLVFLLFAPRQLAGEFERLGATRLGLVGILGGPVMLLFSYTGFVYTVLGHGAVIQPAAATLVGLALAAIWLSERMTALRIAGALAIVAGLVLLGAEAVLTMGGDSLFGDFCFAAAGTCWATFGTLVRRWNIDSKRAMVIVSVFALVSYAPLHALAFGFQRMLAVGVLENLLQILVQGVLAGPVSIYLFTYTARVLGAGRATTFSAFVPVFTLLIGFLTLREIPTLVQLAGLAAALIGVRLVMGR